MNRSKITESDLSYKLFMGFNVFVMIMVLIITLYPYLHVLAKSFNEGTDSLKGGITIFPRMITLQNYQLLLNDPALYQATMVSVIRVILTVVLQIAVQFSAAYALSRREVPGLTGVNLFFLIPTFISGGVIAQYLLFSAMGLLNNFWVYILPGLFSFYNIMLIRSYITLSIPDSLVESFRIDGVGEIGMLCKLILPLSKPILACISLWAAVGAWNDWTTTLMFVRSPALHTLQYKLMQVIKESERITAMIQAAQLEGNVETAIGAIKTTPDALISAQIIVATIPIVIVYPFLQKYFVQGITLGAVKG